MTLCSMKMEIIKKCQSLGDVYEECQKDDYECMSPLLKQLKKFGLWYL